MTCALTLVQWADIGSSDVVRQWLSCICFGRHRLESSHLSFDKEGAPSCRIHVHIENGIIRCDATHERGCLGFGCRPWHESLSTLLAFGDFVRSQSQVRDFSVCTDNTSPYAHTRTVLVAHATCDYAFGSRA